MGSQSNYDTCARCGIVAKLHGPGMAGCDRFQPATTAQEAADATEAARAAGEHRERTYKQLRRAVANWHLTEARRLLDQLQEGHQ